MSRGISRFLSLDDLWSVLGYVMLLAVNRLRTPPMELSTVSLLASGMLAVFWLSSENLRARNLERRPDARVLFWALVAVVSILGVIR
ncbi:MAG: hypothetical protein WC971_04145 [Coriobacteriia bacterium]